MHVDLGGWRSGRVRKELGMRNYNRNNLHVFHVFS